MTDDGTIAAPRVAFLGTGIMGAPMARHIAQAGYRISAWNRTDDKARPLAAFGVEVAPSAVQAVSGADIVIVMVTSGQAANQILFEDGRAAAHIKAGAIVVMMSSIAVDVARTQAARLRELGIGYVDAPVSGGEKGAIDKTLAIMAGGSPDDIAAVSPLLGVLGRVTYIGPVGTGQLAKLANQVIVAGTITLIAEAFTLAERGGADPARVRQALTGGFADSVILQQHGLRMIERRFTPGGDAINQVKDLDAAARIAEEHHLALPATERVAELFRAMVAAGDGGLDHSGIFLHIARLNGLPTHDIIHDIITDDATTGEPSRKA
ncbi:NAD(P)-dependent oxidoreductase [Nguyenibacter vanlangensis]|uniref:NAD(P)-dependent oxidoreductase n=1 Tax=Nguyenibacter vanlangensis TaxID=1216886 RepID=A0A7Y7IYG1_9PROT|nr:NAD(P)-dependent oxidoreductase [Nguyenibacter vanlangensis]NVN12708.1 NAD(P)-dependent oxidoreductase [Nguyenibacter vanlangensis]